MEDQGQATQDAAIVCSNDILVEDASIVRDQACLMTPQNSFGFDWLRTCGVVTKCNTDNLTEVVMGADREVVLRGIKVVAIWDDKHGERDQQ